MSNTYVIQSMTYVPAANIPNPQVTIVGTVNGTQVTVQLWYLQITAAASISAFETLLQPVMLAAYQLIVPPSPVTINPITSSFTV